MDRRVLLGAAGIAGVAAFSKLAAAGPLAPPAGPVTSTGKTLTEVEPRIAINAVNTPGDGTAQFRITAPGSYYLTGNIDGVAGKSAIVIASSDVAIDLMGFAVRGVPGALSGILLAASFANIAIRNGTVRGFPGSGVQLFEPHRAEGCLIEGVFASGNGGMGIGAGVNAVVRACQTFANGDNGFAAGNNSSIEGCVAYGNKGRGFLVGLSNSLRGCSALENFADGFSINGDGIATDCIARGNGVEGFQLNNSSAFGCAANQNGASGFFGDQACVIHGCVATFNAQHGVRAEGGGVVTDNYCRGNGGPSAGAGVYVVGEDTRVEGNHCTGNHYGVRVVSAGNLILRNACSGSVTNFDIVAGNRYGPIVNITAGGAAAASGNAAVSTLTSTDPWANFAH